MNQRQQLNRLEKRFEQLSAPGSKVTSPKLSPADTSLMSCSAAQKSKSIASRSGVPSPLSSSSMSPSMPHSNEPLPVGGDISLQEEPNDEIG